MSENNEGGNGTSGDTPPADEFKPITSQDELNRLIGDRVKRATAKYADYDDVKAKANKLAEIEESSKTEAQKAIERAEAAERRASELERQNTAARLAAEYGVPVEVIHGGDEAAMRAVAERVQSWAGQRAPATPPARSLRSGASAGDNGESGKGRAAAALRQLRQG